jgi:hypothetical protein
MRHSLQRISAAAILLLLAMSIGGCARAPARTARAVEGRRTPDAAALEARLTKLRDATPSLKGLAWVELITADEDRRTEAAIVVERPDRIRIDAMDALADVWAQAGSDGKSLWLYLPGRQKLYEGHASPRTLHRLAEFDWEPADLVSIVAGLPPLPAAPELVQVGAGRDARFVVPESGVELHPEGGKHRTLRCTRVSEDGTGRDYEIIFSDYRRAGGAEFPHRIEASFPSRNARILVEYHDVQVGAAVDPSVFPSPKGRGTTEKVRGE